MKATSLLHPRTVPTAPVAPTPAVAPIRPTIAPKRCKSVRRARAEARGVIHKETLADALVLASLVPSRAVGIECINTLMNQIIFSVLSGRRVTLRGHGQFRQKITKQTAAACNYGPRKASTTKGVAFKLSKERRIKILPR